MRIDLSGRGAVVTGAASGIGRAIAAALHESGAQVALADINVAAANDAALALDPDGKTARAFAVDVTSRDSIVALHEDVSGWQLTDLILNVAGWNIGQPFVQNEPDFMAKVIALNLAGPIHLCHTFLKPLVEAGHPGAVVNIASDAGRVGSLGETVYAASKGGVIAFTKSLAREMARYKISVNAVSPGPTDTPLFRMQPEKIQEALIRAIPFRRLATPEEVAAAAVFLASPQASYVTGQVLSVSGGLTMVD